MGKKRRRTPEIRSHLVRLRPGHFRSQSLRQNQYLPITGSSAKQVCRELPSAWKPHLHWNPLGRLALIAHVQHRCGGARSSPPSSMAEQPTASTFSNDIVDGKPVRWSWLVPRPRLCASAQNERADTKSCSNLRTSCPWPSRSSNLHHPHARKLLLPCSRRSSWPQALTLRRTHERECRMLTALCPIDGARAPPLAPCSEGAARLPASVGRSATHSHRSTVHSL